MFQLLSRVRPASLRHSFSPLHQLIPSRALSHVVRSDFAPFTSQKSLGAIFSATKVYKTDITPKQFEILEELKFMKIVPVERAKILENIAVAEPGMTNDEIRLDSVLRKRRLKMKKHKLRKRRKAQRALRRKLKKD